MLKTEQLALHLNAGHEVLEIALRETCVVSTGVVYRYDITWDQLIVLPSSPLRPRPLPLRVPLVALCKQIYTVVLKSQHLHLIFHNSFYC